jgi:hypothetical protein
MDKTEKSLSQSSIRDTKKEIDDFSKQRQSKLTELLKQVDEHPPRIWATIKPETRSKIDLWSLESGLHKGIILDIIIGTLGDISFEQLRELYLDKMNQLYLHELGVGVSNSLNNEEDSTTTTSSAQSSFDS